MSDSSSIDFQRGTTFELNGYVTDPENIVLGVEQPVDITGWTITAELVPPKANTVTRPIVNLTVTIIDAANGVYVLDQPDVATTNWLKNTKYNMRMVMTKPNNFVFPVPTITIDCREFL
jgi:hypothetical protein